ncbi:MAG: bifunctional DNA-formamidopyrimidine glycosylase/DNA-(apurinic or apyrimidinic site) lyase [Alphaproteobacteria bacterium GM7ARS4]|nr:bifunctional DNA-formamidopyrimidine glycosylase/DNA-(apurinic or apyrimidinic site) lyase [Alphaproteobacteria bacterium GM7ARS4]
MPELPEVETIRRGIESQLHGMCVTRVTVGRHSLRKEIPPDISQRLGGRHLTHVSRRGKYLFLSFDDDTLILVMHFGMSGSLHIRTHHASPSHPHEHIVFHSTSYDMAYHDPRRFGFVDIITGNDKARYLASIAPDPLEPAFSIDQFYQKLRKRTALIKNSLLNQKLISGLGNIYACEALYHSKISPFSPSCALRYEHCLTLVESIRTTLKRAIACGGSSLKDYKKTDGRMGYFQYQFSVYGQEKRPCPRCARHHTAGKAHIHNVRLGGRSTFFCPLCQHICQQTMT